jgi:hypothetical protein
MIKQKNIFPLHSFHQFVGTVWRIRRAIEINNVLNIKAYGCLFSPKRNWKTGIIIFF